jgi:hypothetical protein
MKCRSDAPAPRSTVIFWTAWGGPATPILPSRSSFPAADHTWLRGRRFPAAAAGTPSGLHKPPELRLPPAPQLPARLQKNALKVVQGRMINL